MVAKYGPKAKKEKVLLSISQWNSSYHLAYICHDLNFFHFSEEIDISAVDEHIGILIPLSPVTTHFSELFKLFPTIDPFCKNLQPAIKQAIKVSDCKAYQFSCPKRNNCYAVFNAIYFDLLVPS
jgi:hypothetical protein